MSFKGSRKSCCLLFCRIGMGLKENETMMIQGQNIQKYYGAGKTT